MAADIRAAGGRALFVPTDVTVEADVALTQAALIARCPRSPPPGGAILDNASNLGVVGMGSVAPYVTAEHGVIGLSRAVALESAEPGVRVTR